MVGYGCHQGRMVTICAMVLMHRSDHADLVGLTNAICQADRQDGSEPVTRSGEGDGIAFIAGSNDSDSRTQIDTRPLVIVDEVTILHVARSRSKTLLIADRSLIIKRIILGVSIAYTKNIGKVVCQT